MAAVEVRVAREIMKILDGKTHPEIVFSSDPRTAQYRALEQRMRAGDDRDAAGRLIAAAKKALQSNAQAKAALEQVFEDWPPGSYASVRKLLT
jgi:hypothetical protein